MKKSKQIVILLLILLTIFSFSTSCFGWNGHSWYLDGDLQKREDGTLAMMMPQEISDFLVNSCQDLHLYSAGTHDILVCKRGDIASSGYIDRWYIVFVPKTSKMFLVYRDGASKTLQIDPKPTLYYRCTNDGNWNWERIDNLTFNDIWLDGEFQDGKMVFCGMSTGAIYNTDKTTVFFQGAPYKGRLTLEILRNQIILGTVLEEIILILPMILAVMVSFLGLRKGLKLLFQVLRSS